MKENNPYKIVWDSVEQHETSLQDWVKNGTLFPPTMEELARRHMSQARFLLSRARDFGRTVEGYSTFYEALDHRNKAKDLLDKSKKNVLRSI